MKRPIQVALTVAALAGSAFLMDVPGRAQDGETPTPTPPTAQPGSPQPATAVAPKTYPPYRRLPNYFGQVGLSEQQKADVYALRGRYQAELAELQRQLDELKRREMEECETILTEAQRKLLTQIRASKKPTLTGSGDQ